MLYLTSTSGFARTLIRTSRFPQQKVQTSAHTPTFSSQVTPSGVPSAYYKVGLANVFSMNLPERKKGVAVNNGGGVNNGRITAAAGAGGLNINMSNDESEFVPNGSVPTDPFGGGGSQKRLPTGSSATYPLIPSLNSYSQRNRQYGK